MPKQPEIKLKPVPISITPAIEKPIETPKKDQSSEPFNSLPQTPKLSADSGGSLEQRIGTRWILIAGIITVLFGVGFFVKYAYDHSYLQPWTRAMIIAVSGLAALFIGEITRRRDYEIVARGTTALGFALLYAAVFSGYRFYEVINPIPAFTMAVCITIAAMTYAVVLDEVLIAFLSLFGGYLTPILCSSGQNLPRPLFTYLLILGLGAMGCAYFRRWRAVNVVAFVGTYLLYTGWFEKFYNPAQRVAEGLPSQMNVALGWLVVFFVIYLITPLLYGLLRKALSRPEDVWLAAVNGVAVFYYLYRILYHSQRTQMALACVGLSAIYLAVMFLARIRCPKDQPLRISLLIMALAFLTVALPLYFKMRPLVIAWAIEGVILTAIGILYRNWWTKAAGLMAACLSFLSLCYYFKISEYGSPWIWNPAFGTWFFVCAAVLTEHLLYRFLNTQTEENPQPFGEQQALGDTLYVLAVALLLTGCSIDWFAHCKWHLTAAKAWEPLFFRGMIVFIIVWIWLMLIRPVCPKSILCSLCAIVVSTSGTVFTVFIMNQLYDRDFRIFLNSGFLFCCLFAAALLLSAWLLARRKEKTEEADILAYAYVLDAVVLLWILFSEQIYFYWKFKNQYAGPIFQWEWKAYMYMSVLWAVYAAILVVIGFWRKLTSFRYLALALFALLLAKIFLLDTSKLEVGYRIAAFTVTGLILVAVSYLYQFARKKGFFDAFQVTADKPLDHSL